MHGCQPVGGKHRFQTLHSIFLIYFAFWGGKRLYSFTDACISAFIRFLLKHRAGNCDSEVIRTDSMFSRSLEPAAPLKASGIPLGPCQSWVQIQAATLICRVTEITNIHKAPSSVWGIVPADDTDYENNELWLLIICWTLRALQVWFHFF